MRVVAGGARGRKLVAPAGRSTRPTSDRVREAMFDMLASRDAIDDAVVVDLFAGSGALGVEALSRGARHATFVEHDRAALDVIRTNLAATGLADQATVRPGDALAFRAAVDLAFVDPPYGFEQWDDLLGGLDAGLAVLESERELEVAPAWLVVRQKRYGGTVVTLAVPASGRATAGGKGVG
jgi:16S rRNA (guanine966-N2)-methyltransferase